MDTQNKMGVKPVPGLLMSMSIPMIISMLVQALYNIVDSIFVAQISEEALTAVSLVFPWQNLIIAVAVGTGVGVNAMLSRWLGAGNRKLANSTALHGLILSVLSFIVVAIIGTACSNLFFSVQTDVPGIIEFGDEYMNIISACSLGCFVACMAEKLLTATGKTGLTMVTQASGAITNIILDPIFIFGLFGVPRLEVAGAAIATVIGQFVGAIVGLVLNYTRNKDINLSFKGFRWDGQVVKHIYGVGLPSIIMQSIGSIMTFGMNQILISFTTTATAVFGVYFKLQSFVFMPVFGITNGVVPLAAYNYGAGKPERIMDTWKWGCIYATCFMVVGFLLFQFVPETLLSMFNPSPDLIRIGDVALRMISWSFLLAGFGIVTGSFFQALGHGMISMWTSIIRQLAALLPIAWLFSRTGNLDLVWLAFPLSEIISCVVVILFLRKVIREQIHPMYGRSEKAGA